MKKNEKVVIGWVDGGMVHGQFASSLINTMYASLGTDNPIVDCIRASSAFLDRSRDAVIEYWETEKTEADWLLWVDSDILLTPEVYRMLCEKADSELAPVVSGIYFVSTSTSADHPFDNPTVSVFSEHKFDLMTNRLHKITASGLGITLIHKSVIEKLREVYGEESLHGTYWLKNTDGSQKFIGEDVSFFLKLHAVKIPVHAHSSAVVTHLKTFGIDITYILKKQQEDKRDRIIDDLERKAMKNLVENISEE